MKINRVLLILAPLLIAGYGALRLIGMMDGQYGPGFDWQVAHLVGLAGMVLFVPVMVMLAGRLPRTWWRQAVVTLTLAGLVASMVQFGADIVEAAMAADKAELKALSKQFTAIPGVEVAFYSVGPQLFFLGLVTLTVMLAAARKLPWWSPVLMLLGIALPPFTLDLIPVAGLCMMGALSPAAGTHYGAWLPGRRSSASKS